MMSQEESLLETFGPMFLWLSDTIAASRYWKLTPDADGLLARLAIPRDSLDAVRLMLYGVYWPLDCTDPLSAVLRDRTFHPEWLPGLMDTLYDDGLRTLPRAEVIQAHLVLSAPHALPPVPTPVLQLFAALVLGDPDTPFGALDGNTRVTIVGEKDRRLPPVWQALVACLNHRNRRADGDPATLYVTAAPKPPIVTGTLLEIQDPEGRFVVIRAP